jgi:hypothetical protein
MPVRRASGQLERTAGSTMCAERAIRSACLPSHAQWLDALSLMTICLSFSFRDSIIAWADEKNCVYFT